MTTKETPKWIEGLGFWNVYFIFKFALVYLGYLNLNVLGNALLLLVLLLPMPSKALRYAKTFLTVMAAVVLLYSESWLPGPASIMSNADNIAGFSVSYMAELAMDFINWSMVGWLVALVIVYAIARHFVRLSVLTLGYFVVLAATPWWQSLMAPAVEESPLPQVAQTTTATPAATAETAVGKNIPATSETIAKWYSAFLDYEKERVAVLPAGLNAKDTPFDIVIMNVCSLSNDDLEAAELQNHPVLSRFNIRFDHFNSATSYSGPATLRLLNAACGQPSHDGLYEGRRPECEIMNRLDQLGFKQHMFLDHAGKYDNYIETMREKAGLTAPLESTGRYPVRYVGFDDEPIADTLSLLRDWHKKTRREKERSVTLFNLIALHDGNRLPRQSHWEAFKPRAQIMLDDLNKFFDELQRSGRKVMFVVVPEHGAAVRGDRVQAPRLRDIPSMRITEVPVLVKFFGLKDLPKDQIHVVGTTSYLALSTLIGKTLESNYFSAETGAVTLEELVKDLPETNPVSENAQSVVLTYKDRDYIRQKDENWVVYPK